MNKNISVQNAVNEPQNNYAKWKKMMSPYYKYSFV